MKGYFFAAIAATAMTISTSAGACPVAGGESSGRPIRPVPTQNVSFQASELVERAAVFESEASSHEASAAGFDREAMTLENRARVLRIQATRVSATTGDRAALLEVAAELGARASADRADAARERNQAAELRVAARALRARAFELVRLGGDGRGGGWRGKTVIPPRSEPVPSSGAERSITL
jgi:hypothetical protein